MDGALCVVLAALAILAAGSAWSSMIRAGISSSEQSHILVAPVVVAWLIWVRRVRLRVCTPSWSWIGPVIVLAGWILSVVGERVAVDVAWHAGALAMLVGAIATVLGVDVMLRFVPAIVALGFLMPVPGQIRHPIAVPLQNASAALTQWLLDLGGFSVVREGNILKINGVGLAIAEACNGMRMVSSLLLVTFAFVFSVPMRTSVRIILLICAPGIALIVNTTRLIPTVLSYGYMRTSTAETIHDASGWAALGLALVLLWLVIGLLKWLEVPIAPYASTHE